VIEGAVMEEVAWKVLPERSAATTPPRWHRCLRGQSGKSDHDRTCGLSGQRLKTQRGDALVQPGQPSVQLSKNT
jgi:hypothetical protein